MTQTIYMPLLDDGTDVWRPVQAESLEGGAFKVVGEMPDDEVWQFPPGSVVCCREQVLFAAGRVLAAYTVA